MFRVNRHPLVVVVLMTCWLGAGKLFAEPVGWMEKYALAENRAEMLQELIPGSEDYFFYHCLHFQTTGQLDRAEAIIKDWLAVHKGRETPAITAMIDRQRLLTYGDSPQRSIDHFVKRFGVNFNHAPPVSNGQRRYPSDFDNQVLGIERLVKETLSRNNRLHPIGMRYVAKRFHEDKVAGLRISLHDFLKRVDGAYLPELQNLVIKELKARAERDRKFGDLNSHRFLTLSELKEVAKQVPSVADDSAFVQAILQRMRPDGDSDLAQQPGVRHEYLKRVADYTRTLPSSYNSLKGAAIYRLLESNHVRGDYDTALLLEYLKLPRNSPLVHPDWARRPIQKANLADNFMGMALLPPIRDEQPLVRAYLEQIFVTAADTKEFENYLKPDYLRRVFAETKLLGGIGQPEQWYKSLTPQQRQSIRDRSELRLAAQNETRYDGDEPTELIVDVKNVDELVVRIYEINTLAYFRTHNRALNTDIDLDGLVATDESKLNFNQPAIQRHREVLKLESISGRGVWIVDLVGKGLRARALIRRGQIQYVQQNTADGMVFTILDEERRPIEGATMLVGAREFTADADGHIALPPVVDRIQRRAIISDGVLAQQVSFEHLRESYSLTAGIYLDRTLAQSGGEAQLVIRPQLTMAGKPIAPGELNNVSVTIQATDMDNLKTTNEIDELKLSQNGELIVPFRVPSRLANINVTLQGTVTSIATSQQTTLTTSKQFNVASIRRTAHTYDAFLTRNAADYVLEVRGRSGEPVPRATVTVNISTEVSQTTVQQTLQSDEQGQINLGPLQHATRLQFQAAGSLQHSHSLKTDAVSWPSSIHLVSDSGIQLPLSGPIEKVESRYRLIEIRGGGYFADVTENLQVVDGLLEINALPAGDYQLIDRDTATVTSLAVVDGTMHGMVAAGKIRQHSVSPNVPLGIKTVRRDAEGLKVQLSGKTDLARLHVFVSRYYDSSPAGELQLPGSPLYSRRMGLPICGYVSDLRLGDEYQYVLRRRYAAKYPGVMLPQPGLILNPWETQETSNSVQNARKGDAVPPAAQAPGAMMDAKKKSKSESSKGSGSSDYDFLADSGVLLGNLRPDEDGVVTIPHDAIKGMPLIRIVVSDPVHVLQRLITAPLEKPELADLRLASTLDIEKSYSFQRGVSVVSQQQPLDLASLGSAQLQVYGSVGSLMRLYKTFVGDGRLNEFDDLAVWNTLDQAQKLDAYARLASHELHLFLWAHDRAFFEKVIGTYLANKKEKQFIDRWLLQEDLTAYTQLWHYNQLSAAERALLAMRLPASREMVERDLREQVALAVGVEDRTRQLIDGALKLDDLFGANAERGKVRKLSTMSALGRELSRGRASGGRRGAQMLMETESLELADKAMPAPAMGFAGRGGLGMGGGGFGGGGGAFYRELDSTKQWAESQWDRLRVVGGPAPAGLIGANGFWSDLASNDVNGATAVSSHLLEPIQNRHAALVALAMCGLPLESGEIGLPTEPGQAYAPEHPVAVVTKRLMQLKDSEDESSILIGQRFTRLGQSAPKNEAPPEPNEFLVGVAYQGQTVVSNPTAARLVVDVFWQIPSGSIPLSGSQFTDSRTITLEPFAVQSIAYSFYFPKSGKFDHYPATVARDETLVARGRSRSFKVVTELTKDNRVTWEKMAREGTVKQIRSFLKSANLRELNWMQIAHRMKDQEVYRAVIQTLGDANLVIPDLWAYSLKHRDESAMKDYFSIRADLVSRVGPAIDSSLLRVDPVEQRTHEFLEYSPLVRARIHRLGQENEILNSTFLGQYRNFIRALAYQTKIQPEQKLSVAYYLLLQNRIQEAIEWFSQVPRDRVATKLQYDYAKAYFAMHREDFETAEQVASRYEDHQIPRWASRFAELADQLRQRKQLLEVQHLVSVEPNGKDQKPIKERTGDLALMDRQKRQAAAADLQPEVVVKVDGNALRIDHRRAKEVTLNLYGVDLELLFSKAPFVREDLQRMAMVRPTKTETLDFEDATGTGKFELKGDLSRQTLLVEVVAGAARSTALYYGGQITTYVSESYGQLQTTDTKSQRPISTAYVKVYAKYPNGSVRFYKDGYTDARGRFDYASISASDAKGASRFAILVLSEEQGATLHDVAAPTQ